ncbi:MAG: ABC transporter substrate-binding protein [Candidatus Acetothermia bacterium]
MTDTARRDEESSERLSRRDFLRLAGATGFAAVLGTYSTKKGFSQDRQGGVLEVAVQHGLDSFDQTESGWMAEPTWAIHEPLVSRDWDNNYAPGLAKSWEFTEEGTVLTLQLREDVEFHDSTKFDTGVVKWYFEEFMGGEILSTLSTPLQR